MNKKLEKEINSQIQKELYSAYLYLSMAAYFEARGLDGFGRWMQFQAQEEILHAMKFFTFVNDRGGRVVLEAIEKPPADFKSIKDVFTRTLDHEKKVTASINNLYKVAQTANDTAAQIMLQWFITEQVEEEKNPSDILTKLDFIHKEDSAGILMLNKELGARVQPTMNSAED